mmetsp:Transcript_13926/g.22736  ORF Transcript_13926/g.22736 Transcript_13926/m.22736 type:complete len:243 (-) Transcript_13926:70-798(-)
MKKWTKHWCTVVFYLRLQPPNDFLVVPCELLVISMCALIYKVFTPHQLDVFIFRIKTSRTPLGFPVAFAANIHKLRTISNLKTLGKIHLWCKLVPSTSRSSVHIITSCKQSFSCWELGLCPGIPSHLGVFSHANLVGRVIKYNRSRRPHLIWCILKDIIPMNTVYQVHHPTLKANFRESILRIVSNFDTFTMYDIQLIWCRYLTIARHLGLHRIVASNVRHEIKCVPQHRRLSQRDRCSRRS